MQLSNLLLSALVSVSAAQSTVYLIRHGEKPADGGNGLSAQGEQRAQCLRTVFGASSSYDIEYIIAEQPKSGQFYLLPDTNVQEPSQLTKFVLQDGSRERPLETVTPLANDLGLTVDTSCTRDDSDCVADLVETYNNNGGSGNILICWEHGQLTDIVEALGDSNAPEYGDVYNIIWTDEYPYSTIDSMTSEDCPGLDSS